METKELSIYDEKVKMLQLAEVYSQSALIPSDFKKKADAFYALEAGSEIGLSPIASFEHIHIIKGVPYVDVIALHALALRRSTWRGHLYSYLKDDNGKVTGVTCTVKKANLWDDEVVITEHVGYYTLEIARSNGLLDKFNWKRDPINMLKKRSLERAIKDAYPDIALGLNTEEDIPYRLKQEEINSKTLKSEISIDPQDIDEITTKAMLSDNDRADKPEKQEVESKHLEAPKKEDESKETTEQIKETVEAPEPSEPEDMENEKLKGNELKEMQEVCEKLVNSAMELNLKGFEDVITTRKTIKQFLNVTSIERTRSKGKLTALRSYLAALIKNNEQKPAVKNEEE
jgi:hypothetical protein